MVQLSRPYPSIDGSYGGSQSRSAKWRIRKCGCAAVAMTDLILYLTQTPMPMCGADYDRLCREWQVKYLTMVPPFGTIGPALAAGVRRYARMHGLPIRARWNVTKGNLFEAMEAMLAQDLPVILAIGPAIGKLKLYRKNGEIYTAVTQVNRHFVTVTAMDETWLRISSWGREYHIHRGEYWDFGENSSLFAVHNCLVLEKQQLPQDGS